MISRRAFAALVIAAAATSATGRAQQSPISSSVGRAARIGLLSNERLRAALLKGLHDAGFDEARNLIVEYRPNVPSQTLGQFAAELVALNVDVIVASGTP